MVRTRLWMTSQPLIHRCYVTVERMNGVFYAYYNPTNAWAYEVEDSCDCQRRMDPVMRVAVCAVDMYCGLLLTRQGRVIGRGVRDS